MPKGKGYGSPSTKIGKSGNLKSTGAGKGGSHSFLPGKPDGTFNSNKTSKTPAATEHMKMPFLPNKPE